MDVRKTLNSISTEKLVLSGLILLGFVLRLRQYLSGRSLWLDEAMLALNIVGRSSSGLIQPLDYQQGGPVVFLLAEKLVITLFGNRELTLRLVPFLAGCAALVLFALLLRQMTGKAGTYIALALFAVGAAPVYYASEVKQYSSDVFVALLLFWLAARHLHISARGRDFILLGVSGVLACWCAHPAVFVLTGTGMTLLLHYAIQKDSQRLKQMVIVVTVWVASFAILYFTSLRGLASDQFLLNYWGDTFLTPSPGTDLSWIPDTLKGVLYDPAGLGATWMLAALTLLIGMLALLRRNWQFAAFFVLTLCAVMAASVMDKYPFVGRLLLFAAPIFLALVGTGVEAATGWFQRPRWLSGGLAVLLAAILLYQPLASAAHNFLQPEYHEHIRPTMAYLKVNREPRDVLYVYFWAVPAYQYYAPLFGMAEDDFIAGNRHENDPQGLLAEIDQLKSSKRVWVLFTHVRESGDFNERDFILTRMKEMGSLQSQFVEPGTSVYLYLYSITGH